MRARRFDVREHSQAMGNQNPDTGWHHQTCMTSEGRGEGEEGQQESQAGARRMRSRKEPGIENGQ